MAFENNGQSAMNAFARAAATSHLEKTLADEAHQHGISAVAGSMLKAGPYTDQRPHLTTTAKQNNQIPIAHHIERLEGQNSALAGILNAADGLISTMRGSPNPPTHDLLAERPQGGLNEDFAHIVEANGKLIALIRERLDEVRALVLG